MRIFRVRQELELRDGGLLIGVYVPGLHYNCPDDDVHSALSAQLDSWIAASVAEVIEYRTQPSRLDGTGNVT